MLYCDQPCLEVWSPDFSSSGLSSPVWTRARCGGAELCNSLEWTEWNTNPVQVQICDACGTAGCASGGYVDITVLKDFVLWTVPRIGKDGRFFPASIISRFGSVVFPRQVWNRFQSAAVEVPEQASFSRADGRSVRDAWAVGQNRPEADDVLVAWLRDRLLAADSLDTTAAIRWVEHWLNSFAERADSVLSGTITSSQGIGARVEKLYFDGPADDDWPALAEYRGSLVPVLGPDHIFVPD